jgi:hypothetical protein
MAGASYDASACFLIACPHCGGAVDVPRNQVNCRIFRHGCDRRGVPLPPHASRRACAAQADPRFGCGRPFTFDGVNPPRPCDYI